MQGKLDLVIPRRVDGELIEQRRRDGYVNATAMCRACNKLFGHYYENKGTKAFLAELALDIGIPISELSQTVRGNSQPQGTWVHPKVAIHLAQWLSPRFAVLVTNWVHEWMLGGGPQKPVPYHLRRYLANRGRVPVGHFSILSEMTLSVIGPMEEAGYSLPDHLLPDISEGRMFSDWLRRKGVEVTGMPLYPHAYEDGRVVRARAYPERHLPDFRQHVREVWLPKRAVAYFEERDPRAAVCIRGIIPRLIGSG